MGFLKNIPFKKEIKIEDLEYLTKLLDTNLSLSNCLNLLNNKTNKKIFEQIETSLSNGIMIEEAIKPFLPKTIKEYMIPLLKKLSFNEALALSLDFYNEHSSTQNNLISKIAYPCILLFVSVSALYLFDLYGIDAIFDLIIGFNANIDVFKGIRIIVRICINIFYYGLLIGILSVILFMQPKRLPLLYIFLSKHFPNSIITTYYSQEFVSLLLTCVNRGYKTKDALNVLMSMKQKPIVSFLAFHLDDSLLQGETMKQATQNKYFDYALARFIKIANYTNDFGNVLDSYTKLAKQRIQNKLKKYSLTIQLSTYFFIGMIIVFIYEILFLPMQAISSF